MKNMTVRAKFKVQRIEASQTTVRKQGGADNQYELVEVRTIVLMPVYSPDPASENGRFWAASPSGEIKLGTINPNAWQAFELGSEYYVDFVKVE